MNIRQSVLGPVTIRSGQSVTGVDIGALVRRLILFDRNVVQSLNLREVPFLAQAFHKAGLTHLLSSGLLRFACGKTYLIVDVERNGVRDLPPNHFSFGIASANDHERFLRQGMAGLQGIPGLKNSERAALEDLALQSVIQPPASYGQDLLDQFDSDIRTNTPVLKMAIADQLSIAGTPGEASFSNLSVQVEETSHRVFHIQASLDEYGIAPGKSHSFLKSSLLAVSNLDQRLADMQAYSSITGFRDREAPLLFGRLSGLLAPLNPDQLEGQFKRMIELADVPDFSPGKRVDVDRLLKARESAECREFRKWLSSADQVTDAQVKDMIGSVRNKIGSVASSTGGKVLRLAATTGIGLIPGAGLILGAVAGSIDSFLVDRLLPKSGVVAFLAEIYPSLFVSP